ncbi:hypothetical protein AB1L42_10550 [Thalassoglobus sp. JC818]|uniref:DUF6985 domain-containing protein n=1 Tax=Thalassoglobus sp. JC818 TaxID=3232136 RepID=UPI00345820DB
MASKLEHPVLGQLIPDQYGDRLMKFRKFEFMQPLWHPDSKKQLEDLEQKDRELVKKWETQPGALPQVCRNFDVHSALQSLGVYELGIGQSEDSDDSEPSAEQVAAYEHFVENEQAICEEVFETLVRYYNFLREWAPDWFVDETDCPETADSIDDLATCVRFDGMDLSHESVGGMATICMGWDVDWDMEHGLQMICQNGKIIAVGNDLYGPEVIVGQQEMMQHFLDDDQKKALQKFCEQVGEIPDEDLSDSE